MNERLRWILRAWRPHAGFLPLLLLMTAISCAATLAYPLVFGHVLERLRGLEAVGGAGVDVDPTARALVGLLLAAGAARLLAALYPAIRAIVNFRIEAELRARLFGRVLDKGPRFFARFRTGDVVTRLIDDIAGYPKVAWFCCSGLFRAFDSAARVLCCMAVMVWLDPPLAAASLLPVPLAVGAFLAMKRRLTVATADQRRAASDTSARLESFLAGVTVLQAFGAEARAGDAVAAQLSARSAAEEEVARLSVLSSVFFQALNVAGQLLVVVVGGLRVLDGSLSLGDFFAFYLFLGLLLPPMMDLPNLLVTGKQAFVCMDRLDELDAFDRAGEGGVCRGAHRAGPIGRLEVRDVHFAHPAAMPGAEPRPVLAGVDLALERGERVALMGEVGAGKTTLLRLLAGLLPVDAGAVRIDGRALEEHDGPALRRRIAYAAQEPLLFATTVRENVLLGRPADEARLGRALELAGVADEVARLPGGLDHRLGPRGRGLSGGQRQRVALARALYGEPELLLLDDVTAALDADNEERFWQRLLAARPDTTALVVTHRAQTSRRMDRVVRLEAGVVEGA